MEYGYARVSTKEQNEERQLIALAAFGIQKRDIFVDKQSGKDFERTQYRRLIRKLKDGDTRRPSASSSGSGRPRGSRRRRRAACVLEDRQCLDQKNFRCCGSNGSAVRSPQDRQQSN